MKAIDLSYAIITHSQNRDGSEAISNLKLQKLLYYAQGFNIAVFDKPLFDDKLVAWQYGPVVKDVYNKFKESGSKGIVLSKDSIVEFDTIIKGKKKRELLIEVLDVYGQFSAIKLMHMTHTEPPWTATPINGEITHKKLRDFFKTRIEN